MRALTPLPSPRIAFALLLVTAGGGATAADPTPTPAPAPAAAAPAAPAVKPEAREPYALMKDGRKIPLFSEKHDQTPVAKVAKEAVTLGELTDALATMHQGATGKASAKDFSDVLDRLVDIRLAALEAEAMGITDLEDFKAAMRNAEDKFLRDAMRSRAAATAKVDPAVVKRRVREATREWKVRTLLFATEADAKAFEQALRKGGTFEDLGRKALEAKKAEGTVEPTWMRGSVSSDVDAVLLKLPNGGVTLPLKYGPKLAIIQVLGKRQVNDPQAKAAAEAAVLTEARVAAQKKVYKQLLAKYATVDRALLAKLDLAAPKPGLDALEKDPRVLATIQGEKPITVGELVRTLRQKYFHGAEQQAKSGRLNKEKAKVFEDTLEKRLFAKEARAIGLQNSYAVRRQMREFRDQVLLATTVERVILPSVKVTDEDVKKYYEAHPKDFTAPAMLKVDGIGFERADDAQKAVEKLRSGTDFKWLVQNSAGKSDPSKISLPLDGSTVSVAELPDDVGRALAGAKAGDYRLCADPGGAHLVVRVLESFPPTAQPIAEVRGTIEEKVRAQKINAAFAEWTAKLRQQYPVEILIAKFGE